jgi:3-hydroxyacyl-[acyl-carrier-protein] dehydratase
MPGVLIIETMAQVGAVLLLGPIKDRAQKLVLFTTIEDAKFRKPVVPGDQLRVEMQVLKRRTVICKMKGKVTVDGKLVAEATLMCQLGDRPVPPDSAFSSGS